MTTTLEDLNRLVSQLQKLYEPLFEDNDNEETYDLNQRLHFVLQKGSQTYGRAYRLFLTGGTKDGRGHHKPFWFSGLLGTTKKEAEALLRGIILGIEAGLAIAEKENKK